MSNILQCSADPSQWPETYKELKEIDTILRCGICYEIMETAMMLQQCSHNYCSLCIRKYMTFKTQCPICRVAAVDSDLKNNRAMDDIIKQFLSVRGRLLQLLKNLPGGSNVIKKEEKRSNTATSVVKTQDKGKNSSTMKTRKVRHSYKHFSDNSEDDSDKDFLPLPKSSKKKRAALLSMSDSDTEDDAIILVDSKKVTQNKVNLKKDEQSQYFTPVKSEQNIPFNKRISTGNFLTAPVNNFEGASAFQTPKHKDLANVNSTEGLSTPTQSQVVPQPSTSASKRVNCPVCSVSIPERHINLHLDRCLSNLDKTPVRSASTSNTNNSATPPTQQKNKRKLMPKLVYNILADKELKKKLTEVGLPTNGNRQAQIKRHQELTLQYNAQCDSLNPKTVQELVKEMLKAERTKTQLSFVPSSSSNSSSTSGPTNTGLKIEKSATEAQVDDACKQYVKKHKSQFSQLIAETKMRMKKKREEELAKKKKEKAESEKTNENITSKRCETWEKDAEISLEVLPSLISDAVTEEKVKHSSYTNILPPTESVEKTETANILNSNKSSNENTKPESVHTVSKSLSTDKTLDNSKNNSIILSVSSDNDVANCSVCSEKDQAEEAAILLLPEGDTDSCVQTDLRNLENKSTVCSNRKTDLDCDSDRPNETKTVMCNFEGEDNYTMPSTSDHNTVSLGHENVETFALPMSKSIRAIDSGQTRQVSIQSEPSSASLFSDDSAMGTSRQNSTTLPDLSTEPRDKRVNFNKEIQLPVSLLNEHDSCSNFSIDSGACSDAVSMTGWLSQRAPSDSKTEVESDRSSPNFDLFSDMGLGEDFFGTSEKSPDETSLSAAKQELNNVVIQNSNTNNLGGETSKADIKKSPLTVNQNSPSLHQDTDFSDSDGISSPNIPDIQTPVSVPNILLQSEQEMNFPDSEVISPEFGSISCSRSSGGSSKENITQEENPETVVQDGHNEKLLPKRGRKKKTIAAKKSLNLCEQNETEVPNSASEKMFNTDILSESGQSTSDIHLPGKVSQRRRSKRKMKESDGDNEVVKRNKSETIKGEIESESLGKTLTRRQLRARKPNNV